jgi:hypothetical protein
MFEQVFQGISSIKPNLQMHILQTLDTKYLAFLMSLNVVVPPL